MNNLTVWPLAWHRFHKLKMMVRIHPLSLILQWQGFKIDMKEMDHYE